VKTVDSAGKVTQTTFDSDVTPKAPTGGANNTYKYWDVLGTGGTSTNYFSTPPYITAPPNPQIAVGPDDIITIVNRTIARYPNINAGTSGTSAVGVTNPYFNPPTEYIWLDNWLGLIGTTALQNVCPSGTSNNGICIIDNASVRYDQMQGRFVVLFTVTDIIAHRSNFILIVSRFSQFTKCTTTQPTCPASSPLFSAPVIAPVVGGTQTGGINAANWYAYVIPINLIYNVRTPAPGDGTSGLGTGIVGVPSLVTTGGSAPTGLAFVAPGATAFNFVTALFCPNGGPALPLTNGVGGTNRSCTNYYPTAARMGLDNDNITLIAPVLDSAFAPSEGTLPITPGQRLGPYAGTRVLTLSKLAVYQGTAVNLATQPPTCDTDFSCTAVNLSDNVVTGTLTEVGPACVAATPGLGVCELTVQPALTTDRTANPIPAIFWEPANLRGRSLASFDSQISPLGSPAAGIITPITHLLGRQVTGPRGDIGGGSLIIFDQPIVFSCPAGLFLLDPVKFCGVPSVGVVADQPLLGQLAANASTIGVTTNPNTVGQGFSAAQMTTNPLNTPVTPTTSSRLFVGDQRPLQVIFREGLLYQTATVRLFDSTGNALGSSTVLYDLLRTCATPAAFPTCSYSPNGTGGAIPLPFLVMESEWTNGQNASDPANDIPGFGFYAPMFDTPANVVNSGPVSPISLFPWLEKLFVGMTTGGTSNVAATFSKDFPSLWDFRPGDDAYDTVTPFIDPYLGISTNTVPCPGDLTVTGTITPGSANVTVNDTTGLGVGMFVRSMTLSPAGQVGVNGLGTSPANWTISSITGNVVRLSANVPAFATGSTATSATVTIVFSRTPATINSTTTSPAGITDATNQIVVGTAPPTGVQIGSSVAGRSVNSTTSVITGVPGCPTALQCAAIAPGGTLLIVSSLSNIGAGETVGTTATATITASVTAGSTTISVPAATASGGVIFPGDVITGTGIPAGTTAVTGNGTGTTVVLSAAPTASNAALPLTVSTTILPAGTIVLNTGVNGALNQILLNNAVLTSVPIGRTVSFSSTALIPAGTTVTNFGTNGVIFLSNNLALPAGITSTCPLTPAAICTTNIPLAFGAQAGQGVTSCPMIQWSVRGGASTDPNDGSLWLFGEFAKNRFASIPGPGQWGTAVANYALDFPATDLYNNDNTFFGDVAPGNGFFTWIQIAKNLNLAQPSAVGPCPTSPAGSPPVLQPPAPGTTPVPAPSTLQCPFFNPTAQVTRAEMAYWVIRSQMDEQAVSNFLCATGGDPTGVAACAVNPGANAFTFGDATAGSITNPFLSNPGAGFQQVTNAQLARYIEVMARRGYTKGKGVCTVQGTTDAIFRYCPNDLITRGEMAVFLIRAKMNNVFPTSLSGVPGDKFGLFQQSPSYFTDTNSTQDFYIYIQKMRELRITNGTGATAYSPGNPLTRQEIATFVVRAFFL